jgi:hypothetical protein
MTRLPRFFSSALAVAVLTSAGAVSAQITAAGPYYATPSWDQTMPSGTRFVVLSNFDSDAVLDRETGLVWQRALAGGLVDYPTAARTCAALTIGNRPGWRLPAATELGSLFDPSVPAPFLPAGHPFTGFPTGMQQGLLLWSNTITPSPLTNGSGSWHVTVGRPNVSTTLLPFAPLSDNTALSYLCVRGGPGAASVP